MVIFEQATLWVHIGAGVLSLVGGAVAIVSRKGGRRHRRAGRAYVYSMALVAVTALGLFGAEPGASRGMLALIAVFSAYFVFSGYRVLGRTRPDADVGVVDRAALGLLGLAAVGLLTVGSLAWLDGAALGPVLVVFGAIGTAVFVLDAATAGGLREGGTWLGEHVFRMGAGYIATVTAVSTVNLVALPPVARWLWPTVVGVPAIAWAIRHYEAAFGLR